jgi:signal transduction histidine kinase
LKELTALPQSGESKTRVNHIGDLHIRYNDLFQREVAYAASSQVYGESRYRQEKEKILETALRELEQFRAYAQKNLEAELEQMGSAARAARRRAIITTLALLGIGFALCFAISRSITTPLLALQHDDVREVSAPARSSASGKIPEIRALAERLRLAKARARDANQSRAAFVHMVSNEFATPLLSLKNRLHAFRSSLGEHATAEQKSALAVMADETERLIQACVRVQANAPVELSRSESQQGGQAEAISGMRPLY